MHNPVSNLKKKEKNLVLFGGLEVFWGVMPMSPVIYILTSRYPGSNKLQVIFPSPLQVTVCKEGRSNYSHCASTLDM